MSIQVIVSILTGLERPVQRYSNLLLRRGSVWFQSSPALKDRCNLAVKLTYDFESGVSILTGLERPVQLLMGAPRRDPTSTVSILTGLERPVQRSGSLYPERKY